MEYFIGSMNKISWLSAGVVIATLLSLVAPNSIVERSAGSSDLTEVLTQNKSSESSPDIQKKEEGTNLLFPTNPDQMHRSRTYIGLDSVKFDTAKGEPQIPEELKIERHGTGPSYYLMQFSGAVQESWVAEVRMNGAEVYDYIPNNAFIVRMDANIMNNLKSLPYMEWVGIYQPYYKIDPAVYRLAESQKNPESGSALKYEADDNRLFSDSLYGNDNILNITILTINNEGIMESLSQIKALAKFIFNEWEFRHYKGVRVQVDASSILDIALIDDVYWIEPYIEPQLYDEISDEIVGGNWTVGVPWNGPGSYVNSLGFDGTGVVVAVADTGLDDGDNATMHPDLVDRVDNYFWYGSETDAHDGYGHGTHCAGIIAGSGVTGTTDGDGYLYGIGVAPNAHIVAQKIFADSGAYLSPNLEDLTIKAVNSGATVGSNSWGASVSGAYTTSSAEFDALTRDADPDTPGEQQYILEFSAGNSGPTLGSIGSPATGKNVIATGASENYRPDQSTRGDDVNEIAGFSSRGPTEDGRIKPDIVAPGTWIAAALSSSADAEWCWKNIDSDYVYCGGTSMSGPHVSGGAALFVQYYNDLYGVNPSPAMTKAALINGATNLNDSSGTSPIPNMDEGWGIMDLRNTLAFPHDIYYEDQQIYLETGESQVYEIYAGDKTIPIKITLAWTDPPAFAGANPTLVNNLDLRVTAPDSSVYYGNQFTDGWSDSVLTSTDSLNNIENVFINPSDIQYGKYTIEVIATNVGNDSVPSTAEWDQDFALVVTYISVGSKGVVELDSTAYQSNAVVGVILGDLDLDLDPMAYDVATVELSSSPTGDTESSVVLTEMDIDAGVFQSTIQLVPGAANPDDGNLQVAEGDTITVTYNDADDGTGNPAVVTDSAIIDDTPPVISNVVAIIHPYARVEITWETDELANGLIRYDLSTPPTIVAEDFTLGTTHSVMLVGLEGETTYWFEVEASDLAQNTVVDDNSSAYYNFLTSESYRIALFKDDDAWNAPSNEEILQKHYIPYTVFSSSDMGSVGLSVYDKVIIISDQTDSYYASVSANLAWFEAYASNGGILQINAAVGGGGGDWTMMPGGITRSEVAENDVDIVYLDHPILNTPNTITASELDGWNNAAEGYFNTTPPASVQIITHTNFLSVLVESAYGDGFIIASIQPLEWALNYDRSDILENILLYRRAKADHDVIVTDTRVTEFLYPMSATYVNASVWNIGWQDESNILVNLTVNGTTVDSTTIGFLGTGSSTPVSFFWSAGGKANYSIAIEATPVPGEIIIGDNVNTRIIKVFTPRGFVLMDRGHDNDLTHGDFYKDMIVQRYWVNYTIQPLSVQSLSGYDVFITVEARNPYTADEITAIQAFVDGGEGLFVIGDDFPSYYDDLTLFAGIGWISEVRSGGTSTYINPHEITTGVSAVYSSTPMNRLTISGKAQDVIYDKDGVTIQVAASQSNLGKVVALVDDNFFDNWNLMKEDNLILERNIIDWLNSPPADHDLAIMDLMALDFAQLFAPTDISATLWNLGQNDETNIIVNMTVDSVVINSTTVALLQKDMSTPIGFVWTPDTEGNFTVGFEVQPVTGEDIIVNNEINKTIWVTSIPPFALFRDANPWGQTSNEDILRSIQKPFSILESSDIGVVDLSIYQKVIIVNDQPTSFYNAIETHVSWFESYVNSGGVLEIHAADSGSHGGSWATMPGGFTHTNVLSDIVNIIYPGHPMLTAPNIITDNELDNWDFSVHGYFDTVPTDTTTVLTEATGMPVLTQSHFGFGAIIASMQTLEWGYDNGYSTILKNIILYIPEPLPDIPPVVNDISPGGTPGETHAVGDIVGITWDAVDDKPWPNSGNVVNISYGNTPAGGTVIVNGEYEDGVYLWDTSSVLPGFYFINISVYDSEGKYADANSSYSFELIQDTTAPVISNVVAQPDPQKVAGIVTISAMATDDIGVVSVFINITDPNNATLGNFSMGYNPVTYKCSHKQLFLTLGHYQFVIWAGDTTNKWASALGTFNIKDTTIPVISGITVAPGVQEVLGNVSINVTATDNYATSEVVVNITKPDGTWLNTTMNIIAIDTYQLEQSYDIVGQYNFTVWAVDTSSNWAFGMSTFTIVDNTPPSIQALDIQPPIKKSGDPVNVSATVTDNHGLSMVRVHIIDPNTNPIGNFSMLCDASTARYYWAQSYSVLGIYDFTIIAFDTSGNVALDSGTFTIIDGIAPLISDLEALPNPQEVFRTVKLSANVTDNVNVNTVSIELTDPDSSPIGNFTMSYDGITGKHYYEHYCDVLGQYQFEIWANDNSNNFASSNGTFRVSDTTKPTFIDFSVIPNEQEIDENVSISSSVTDNYAILEVVLNITKPDSTWINMTMDNILESEYNLKQHFKLPGTYIFTIIVYDTSNNFESVSGQFVIVDSSLLPGTISGRVINGMNPIAKADVELIDANGDPVLTEFTDDNGDFVFTGVLPGDYSIRVNKEGYEEYVEPGIVLISGDNVVLPTIPLIKTQGNIPTADTVPWLEIALILMIVVATLIIFLLLRRIKQRKMEIEEKKRLDDFWNKDDGLSYGKSEREEDLYE